jgi:CheY-like chemotaxis protein
MTNRQGSESSETAHGRASGRAAHVPARRILLVDDNIDSANIAALLLKQLGQEVMQVYDGPSALDVAADFMPDVIILDIEMPGLGGLEVARALRALAAPVRDARIVAYTGHGQAEYQQAAEAAGFNEFLLKPVSLAQWIRILGGSPEA